MDNHEWGRLFSSFYPSKLVFEENKKFFTKIAFDVFQLNSSPTESLWILEDGADGKQYLSATYDYDDTQQKEAAGEWNALANKDASMVVLCYKNFPIHKFASAEFGFDASDAHIFSKLVASKANSDKSFVSKVMGAQPKEKQDVVYSQFPELAQID
jgi:hypothetical protein